MVPLFQLSHAALLPPPSQKKLCLGSISIIGKETFNSAKIDLLVTNRWLKETRWQQKYLRKCEGGT